MGLIRSSLVISVSTILFLTLFLGNLLLTLTWSLEYDTLGPQLEEFTGKVVEDFGAIELVQDNYEFMEIYCLQYDSFNVSEQGIDLVIPCEVITSSPAEVISFATDEIIKQVYYKEYDCNFWECIKTAEQPYVIVSAKAQSYWKTLHYWSLLASIVLFGLLFLLTDKKRNSITITGVLMILTALPFRKLDWAINMLPEGQIADIVALFFTRASNVFLTMIIIGAIVLLVGLALEIFGAGMKIKKIFWKRGNGEKKDEENTFTKEEVKTIVKKEIKKEKKKEEQKEENAVEKLTDVKPKKPKNNKKKN